MAYQTHTGLPFIMLTCTRSVACSKAVTTHMGRGSKTRNKRRLSTKRKKLVNENLCLFFKKRTFSKAKSEKSNTERKIANKRKLLICLFFLFRGPYDLFPVFIMLSFCRRYMPIQKKQRNKR